MPALASTFQPPIALGPEWLDPEFLIETFGTLGLLAIVFIESGLLVGFFLPGDSLLFTAGLLSANDTLPDVWLLLVTVPLAAIAGDQVGYMIGRKAGPAIFRRPDSRLFRQEYVEKSHEFFERPSALRELGLSALQVWQSVSEARGRRGDREVVIRRMESLMRTRGFTSRAGHRRGASLGGLSPTGGE